MKTVSTKETEATNFVGTAIGNLYEDSTDALSRSDVLHDHNGKTQVEASEVGDTQFRSGVLHDHGSARPFQDDEPFNIEYSQADSLSRGDALNDHG